MLSPPQKNASLQNKHLGALACMTDGELPSGAAGGTGKVGEFPGREQ